MSVEELVRAIESAPESKLRATALELMQRILELQGEALQAIVALLRERGDAGRETIRAMTRDDLLAGMLSLHDLHPDDMTTRVERALRRLGPGVELIAITADGAVKLRVKGADRSRIEDAVLAAAPDAAAIQFEEAKPGFVPIEALVRNA